MSYLSSVRSRSPRSRRRSAILSLVILAFTLQILRLVDSESLLRRGPSLPSRATGQVGDTLPSTAGPVPPPSGSAGEGDASPEPTTAGGTVPGPGAPSGPPAEAPPASSSPAPPGPTGAQADGGVRPGPTLTVPPPPGVPIPEGAVLLYETHGAGAARVQPPRRLRELYPTDILRALVCLEREGRLSLSREQARQLLPVVRGLDRAHGDLREARRALLEVLTPEQARWLEAHRPQAGDLPSGAPERSAGDLARKAADSLR